MGTNGKKPVKEKAVDAALALAAGKSWADVTLREIADRADIPLAELYDHIEDKTDILVAYGRRVDRRVLAGIKSMDADMSVRDRLFDILMERFDVLNDDREALVSILRSFCLDPKQAVIGLPHLGRSMSWMLEAAGVETSGITGAVKVAGMTAIYLKTLKAWKDDESADLAKTMAALDRNLGRAEQMANMVFKAF